ncbi:MAG TPA: FHA domain-containing protein, partial [Kofleriaceae bacterium]|nr:FHA domain-containing protein [Kofleriaceae bacterium]
MVALECARPLVPPARLSVAEVDEVSIGRGADRGHRRITEEGRAVLRIDIPDGWMSSDHLRLRREAGDWMVADSRSKNGTYLRGQRIERAPLADGDLIEAGGSIFLFRSEVKRSFREPADVVFEPAPRRADPLATLSIPYARDLAALRRVVVADVPVVLTGETGTGKEVIARTVHELSGRPGAFVAINCGALPASLIESELFGYRKGAFSGATEDRPGLIRSAHHGTLFLDEIAELPEPSQVALLRVLQEREVLPVGATRAVPV